MKHLISVKHINTLAIPALISGISEPILSLTDLYIVGQVTLNPTQALGAIGIVATFLNMLIWVLGQTRSSISSIISQYLGANKLHKVKDLPAQAILIIVSIGLFIVTVTYPLASYIFSWFDAKNIILQYSVEYYRIRVFGFPFTLFVIAVFGTFRGLQNTFYPMLIAIVGVVVNIILDIVLVHGVTAYIPAMHIKGAAYASVIAQLVMAIMACYLLLTKTQIKLKIIRPFNKEIKTFLVMVGNLTIRTLALNLALILAAKYATSYGDSYIAAYTIAINIWFLGAFIIDGYSSAGNILSGKLYGAKAYKLLVNLNQTLIKFGVVIGVIIALVGFLFYNKLGQLFSEDILVLNQFNKIFWLVLIMQPICALAFIFDGIFKGLGKMKILRNVLVLSTFLVFVPILWSLDKLELKLYAIFIAFISWMIARGLPLYISFRKQFLPLAQKQ